MESKLELQKADVIVPVFNEEDILEDFYRRICALNLDLNLIFIDNASSDNSLKIIESFPDVVVIRHQSNEGYGSSLIDGMKLCRNSNIIIIDADCEYPPEEIPNILSALDDHDLVYTSRLFQRSSAIDANMPYLKLLGNKIISGLFNRLFHQKTTDLYTGCKGFKRHCIEGLHFKRKGFEHVLEFACLLSRSGYHIFDIPIDFTPRGTGRSKMSHLSETTKFLFLLLYFRTTAGRTPGTGQSSNE
jgi:glycosyltransferase involved in cell wall biosynthesis